jgi:hypothetical protein
MKYYTTAAPDTGSLNQYDTLEDAVARATTEVQNGGLTSKQKRRYVVQIVAVVEEDRVPIKVTYFTK